ncbi:MAG TPA: M23 family metallopeptidase [Patescibacteria group bacterium]|nr:M23 family metallopeptidase [Patescibacteria group bacterium]
MNARRVSKRAALLLPVVLALASCNFESQESGQGSGSDCPYRLPYPNTIGGIRVTQGISDRDNYSHRPGELEEYAIDFALPEGTPVLAAREGVVSQTNDGETLFGNASFASHANFVIVDHGDGVYSLYYHLQSVVVERGQEVGQGQLLGYSGRTGWTDGKYHLHFQLQERGGILGQSIPPCFVEADGVPQLDERYVSLNQMVMVQGMRVERSSNQLVGIWAGLVTIATQDSEGTDYTYTNDFEVTIEGQGKSLTSTAFFWGTDYQIEAGLGEREGDYSCFAFYGGDGSLFRKYCFRPISGDELDYRGTGIDGDHSGILHRVDPSALVGVWEGETEGGSMFPVEMQFHLHAEIRSQAGGRLLLAISEDEVQRSLHVGIWRTIRIENSDRLFYCFTIFEDIGEAMPASVGERCFRSIGANQLEYNGGDLIGETWATLDRIGN